MADRFYNPSGSSIRRCELLDPEPMPLEGEEGLFYRVRPSGWTLGQIFVLETLLYTRDDLESSQGRSGTLLKLKKELRQNDR